jgi:hypothetical protein
MTTIATSTHSDLTDHSLSFIEIDNVCLLHEDGVLLNDEFSSPSTFSDQAIAFILLQKFNNFNFKAANGTTITI